MPGVKAAWRDVDAHNVFFLSNDVSMPVLSSLSLQTHGNADKCGGSVNLRRGCQARELVRQRVDAEVEAARRDIDAHEIAQIPRAKLEPLYVDFGCVAKDAQQHITLTNSGQVGNLCEEAVCCDVGPSNICDVAPVLHLA